MTSSPRLLLAALLTLSLAPACGGSSKSATTTPGAEAMAGWTRLGERTVDGRMDRDSILVGADSGRFRVLQIIVHRSPVEMYDVVIHFGDGTTFAPPTRMVFDKDTASRIIDLPGGNRVIQQVDFRYGNLPGGGQALVQLWAR